MLFQSKNIAFTTQVSTLIIKKLTNNMHSFIFLKAYINENELKISKKTTSIDFLFRMRVGGVTITLLGKKEFDFNL